MKKPQILLSLAVLAALAAMLPQARSLLPQDNRALVAKKYAGWSGVLRLWIFEGWQAGGGTLSGWLNRCVAGFERRHPGVYVQPQAVDADAIRTFSESGILPPDMLLFPPGLLDSPAGLLPIRVGAAVRPELARAGLWGGDAFAVPVALGGYQWVCRADAFDAIAGGWRDAGLVPAVAPDDAWHCRSAALLALCAGFRGSGARDDPGTATPELDFGLPADGGAPTPLPAAPDAEGCALPPDFAFDADAFRRFINGDAPALLAAPPEICRLRALADQGRSPEWRIGDAAAFTDQLLCLAVVDRPDAERLTLCRAFVDHLLDDACQSSLGAHGAFAVTDAASGLDPGDPLRALDARLRQSDLCVPPCFGGAWRGRAEAIVREFVESGNNAVGFLRRLNLALAKNPNID